MKPLLAAMPLLLGAAAGSPISVSSQDGKLKIGIDDQSGKIVTVQGMETKGVTGFENCGNGELQSIQRNGSNVVVKKKYSCSSNCVSTVDVFGDVDSPKSNEIGWSVAVEGCSDGDWSSSMGTSLQFINTESIEIWLPWNKPSTGWMTDPLQPEPFTNNTYSTGALHGNSVIAEHTTFLFNNTFGISMISNPNNYPHHGKVITTSLGTTIYQRDNALFRPGVVHTFNMHLSLHGPTFRAGLSQSLLKYNQHWSPYNNREQVLTYDGLGSYTSANEIPQNVSFLQDIGYKVNWDLGGRFFPYMGMYLPPVAPGEEWANDAEGSQKSINVTFEFIDQQYLSQKGIGVNPFSYFNIFEYGLNVVYDKSQTTPTGHGDWRNASDYLSGYLIDSMVTNFSCYFHCDSAGHNTAQYSWQNAVVVDPTMKSYNKFLMDQATRKLQNLNQFTGIVIDRSDWCQVYNNDNPGISFVNGSTATNFAESWITVTGQLRDVFSNNKTILMNTVGFASLSLLQYTDGTFSEGYEVDAAGLLGINSPAILWTYGPDECCSSQQLADSFFQKLLYMRVFPMAPYPANDHSIRPGDVQNIYYLKYGQMFKILNGFNWELVDVITADGLRVNTFCNQSHLVAFVAHANVTTATVRLPSGVQNQQYLLPGSSESWNDFTSNTIPVRDGCVMIKADKA
eukprot:TRINITY_DN1522_c4_g1_i1.p1 TRINITY_DN1522_c4_g1~~TRINITY_DN1522_c4_g1_i1.p1  ORF type:complete len:679 (+),score=122.11 TRINITY_DN1522_c4_g1_i1:735-2771(+)